MRLEESFNQNVWHVLQKIKRNCTHDKTNTPILYDIHLMIHSLQDELEVLKKLDEWNVITIGHKKLKQGLQVSVYLKVIQPEFNELFEKYSSLQKFHFDNTRSVDNGANERKLLHSQRNVAFSKRLLFKDVGKFELILKHFYLAGIINIDDYEDINSKMLKSFLQSSLYVQAKKNDTNLKQQNNTKQDTQIANQLPLPITGEIVVSGLNESLKALRHKEPEKSGPKFPYKIPAGTHWNNVIIKFLDEERVEIHVKRLKHITDYKEIGMIGKGKVPTPGEQWLFLKVLAKCFGELSFKDTEAKDKYKKQKQILTETLQNYFSIDYDPFYPYQSSLEKGGNSYKIKLTLLPPPERSNHRQEIAHDDTDPLGIHEFLKTEAPHVADF
jgi:hypothetical protein